jgi:transposase
MQTSKNQEPLQCQRPYKVSGAYILKEQLQILWESETVELMQERLEAWCRIADQSTMLYLKKFAKLLRNHCVGICNYAKYKLTSARIEPAIPNPRLAAR